MGHGRGDPVARARRAQDCRAGQDRQFGAPTGHAGDGLLIDAGYDVASAQVQYSLLDRRPAGAFAGWCARRNVQILGYGTLAGGFLTEHWLGRPDPGFAFANRSLVKYRLIIDDFGSWELFQSLLSTLKSIGDRHGVALSRRDPLGAGAPQVAAQSSARAMPASPQTLDFSGWRSVRPQAPSRHPGQRWPDGPVYGLEVTGPKAGPDLKLSERQSNDTGWSRDRPVLSDPCSRFVG